MFACHACMYFFYVRKLFSLYDTIEIVCGLSMEKSKESHYIESHLLQIIVFCCWKWATTHSGSIPNYYENCSEKKQDQMRYTRTACICKFRVRDCLYFRKNKQYTIHGQQNYAHIMFLFICFALLCLKNKTKNRIENKIHYPWISFFSSKITAICAHHSTTHRVAAYQFEWILMLTIDKHTLDVFVIWNCYQNVQYWTVEITCDWRVNEIVIVLIWAKKHKWIIYIIQPSVFFHILGLCVFKALRSVPFRFGTQCALNRQHHIFAHILKIDRLSYFGREGEREGKGREQKSAKPSTHSSWIKPWCFHLVIMF